MKAFQGYLAITIIRILSLLPLGWAQAFGRATGAVLFRAGGSVRRIGDVNLSLCFPQISAGERLQQVRAACENTAMTFAELGLMWARPPADGLASIREVHGDDLLQAALDKGRGILLLAPHLGNWELANTYIADRCQLTAMYRPARNPVFDRWMHGRREQTGATLVPTTVAGIKALYRSLKDGGVVGFLPDQEPQRDGGEFVPFMGINALTPRLPHQILQRTGATALFIFARRLPDGRGFAIHFVAPPEDIYSADTGLALTAMNDGVAECIRHCPEQYQWLYKRFKRQPVGGTHYYRKTAALH
ncbi:lysophospholipid acyltransferase family protein [Thalassolituus sp. LLYu03]|uniref:lysophospholipid acyltransferase family protein n=1 Tax=Thalassolituus sp. LLYu03 TaxID=3421656 RepID=UPI003D29C6BD